MAVRFAPSPTGRFHVGNLRTAWVSWRLARRFGLPWIVRFEDIDRQRVMRGAQEAQLADLKAIGLVPDLVRIQTARHDRHLAFLSELVARNEAYPCFCSRSELAANLASLASAPHEPLPLYDGHCRSWGEAERKRAGRALAPARTVGWRIRATDASGRQDFLLGRSRWGPGLEASGFAPSYALACGLDDLEEGYELIVRAWDLEPALADQRSLARYLGPGRVRIPAAFHTALVCHDDGHRLEKRSRGVTWPEIEARGWTPGRLMEIFERSADPRIESGLRPALLSEGAVSGEDRRELKLSELEL